MLRNPERPLSPVETAMTEDMTRLNIERARAALARARMDEAVAAVRAPRPADLSRLQEEEARKRMIDSRAGVFRESLRARLGLGEYRGPATPASAFVNGLMSAPLCDADICGPFTPVAENAELRMTQAPAAAQPHAEGEASPPPPPRPRAVEDHASQALEAQGPGLDAGEEPAASGPDMPEPASETAPAPEPAVKKRRKFLGIF